MVESYISILPSPVLEKKSVTIAVGVVIAANKLTKYHENIQGESLTFSRLKGTLFSYSA